VIQSWMMEIIIEKLVIIILVRMQLVSSESAYKPYGLKKNEVMVSNNDRKLMTVYMQAVVKVPGRSTLQSLHHSGMWTTIRVTIYMNPVCIYILHLLCST
jgi:hypothetical protein